MSLNSDKETLNIIKQSRLDSYNMVAPEIVVAPSNDNDDVASLIRQSRLHSEQAQVRQQENNAKALTQDDPLEETGYFQGARDYITGNKAIEEHGLEGLPEFGSTDRGDQGNWWNDLNRTSVFDRGVKKEMLKDQYGDNISFEDVNSDITKVFLRDPKTGNTTESVLDMPGFSMEDLKSLGTQAAYYGGTAIPAVKAASTGLKSMGIIAKMLGIGGASGAQEGALQAINQTAGREGYDLAAIALATGTGAATPGLQRLGSNIINSGKIRNNALLDNRDTPAIFKQGQGMQDKSGIDLSYAQKSGGASDAAMVNTLRGIPEKQHQIDNFFTGQDKQIRDKADRSLDLISKNKDTLQTAGPTGRDAAEGVLNNAREVRKAATEGIYNRAEAFGGVIDTSSIVSKGNRFIAKDGAKANTSLALKPYVDRIKTAKGQYTQVKSIIEDMGDDIGALDIKPKVKATLTSVQSSLRESLEKQNPHYKQAQKIYAQKSVAVDKLKDGIIGKIAGVNTDLKGASVGDVIFGGANATVKQVKQVKSQLDKIDPNAFRDLLREHIEQGLGKMPKDASSPRDMQKAIFGPNVTSRELVLAGLDPEVKGNLMWFYKVLDAAGRNRKLGSDTALKQGAATSIEQDGLWKSIKGLMAAVKDVTEGDRGMDINKVNSAFDSMMSTDRAVVGEWKEIRRMSGGMEAQLAEAVKLITRERTQE
jgi:hypothetical protein